MYIFLEHSHQITKSGTRQIEYTIFYTFGEPSILGGAAHLESKPTKA